MKRASLFLAFLAALVAVPAAAQDGPRVAHQNQQGRPVYVVRPVAMRVGARPARVIPCMTTHPGSGETEVRGLRRVAGTVVPSRSSMTSVCNRSSRPVSQVRAYRRVRGNEIAMAKATRDPTRMATGRTT